MIGVLEFQKLHNLSDSHVYVARNQGKLPEYIFKPQHKSQMLFDETFIYRRRKFRTYIWNQNHAMYWELRETYNNSQPARIIVTKYGGNVASWGQWMASRMWNQIPDSIMAFNVPKKQWEFNKAARAILHKGKL